MPLQALALVNIAVLIFHSNLFLRKFLACVYPKIKTHTKTNELDRVWIGPSLVTSATQSVPGISMCVAG